MASRRTRIRDLFAGIVLTPAVTPQKKRGRPAKVAQPIEIQHKLEESTVKTKPKPKESIPKAVKEQVWLTYIGEQYKCKCLVTWCKNTITVFDFHTGHNIPEKHGGTLDISNLRPICARCNLSMGSQYTITEWNMLSPPTVEPIQPKRTLSRFLCWKKDSQDL